MRGDLKLSHPSITSDLKVNTLQRPDVTQFWMTGRDLKLRLYRDSTASPGESVEIIMEATGRSGDEGTAYRGTFKAILSQLKDGLQRQKQRRLTAKSPVHPINVYRRTRA